MTFEERIQEGIEGKYKGLKNGFNRLNRYVFGIQRKTYYLFGGLSGSAKTTLIDFMLLNAIQDAIAQNVEIHVFYHSYEIDEYTKKANWLSVLIYNKYNRIIPPEKINGFGDNRLTDEEREIVNSELEELNQLMSKINFRWEATNPTGAYKEMWDFYKERGTFEYEDYTDEFNKPQKRIVKYIPNNPDIFVILIRDHIALQKLERGYSLKENIDKTSEYNVTLRNIFGTTIMDVQQFNQGLNSVERMKFKGADISPQQSDFKDSTNPYTDADVVFGIMNAYKMDMEECLGYNISKLKERFRMLKIIKNRRQKDNIAIGLYFKAEAGHFEELPKAEEFKQNPSLYQQYV